ncbi:DUF3368 domain-containing protein [Spirosoma arcticum]
MVVVSDTTTLSNLLLIGHIDLLQKLYGSISIPTAVRDELRNLVSYRTQVDEFLDQPWVAVHSVRQGEYPLLLRQQLDIGEAEAIALAVEMNAGLLIVDELKGRAVAKSLGLVVIGTLGILVTAKREGLISQVGPVLNQLRSNAGFWVSDSLQRQVLESVNES